MSNNQYFTHQPETEHDEQHFLFELLGHEFKFTTDSGVFSKKTIDYGSRALLDNFVMTDFPEGAILDVGCGYGPMGMALAQKYSERQVEMVDVNERALGLAVRNAEINKVENVKIYISDCYEGVSRTDYAAIVSNPPVRAGKEVVSTILRESYQYLKNEGTLTIVLQKKQGAPSAKKLMQEVFGNAEILKKDKGYYIVQSRKVK